MSEENSGIQAGEHGGVVFVRVDGKGTHLNSHLLKQYLLRCLDRSSRDFQADLSRCNYMDSTFMGMLAGIAGKIKERSLPPMKLVNPTERVREMLECLGIDHLFQMVHEKRSTEPLAQLSGPGINKEARSQEMLQAHEKLVEIAPANEARFRDVITLLREKTQKQ